MDIQKQEECVVPESFFNNWGKKSSSAGEQQPKFKKAEGSSLTPSQRVSLAALIPVVRPKGQYGLLKVFVPSSKDSFYSTIISREWLGPLADDLSKYGIKFSISDKRTYGLEGIVLD